jgi:hypothetical protein
MTLKTGHQANSSSLITGAVIATAQTPKGDYQFRWNAEARNRLARLIQAVLAAKAGISETG